MVTTFLPHKVGDCLLCFGLCFGGLFAELCSCYCVVGQNYNRNIEFLRVYVSALTTITVVTGFSSLTIDGLGAQ